MRKYDELQELLKNLRDPTETKVPFTELMNDAATEIEELTDLLERQQVIIRRIYAEHLPDTWFVAGEMGPKDNNGLPQRIEVCPAYGAGWTQIYEKTDRTISTEGA